MEKVSNLKNIQWAFSLNTKNLLPKVLVEYQDNPILASNIDNLFKFLRENNCKNVRERLKNVNTLWNYESALSELDVAKLLIEKGKAVEILPETYEDMISPPDILAVDSKYEVYIEVTRITDDSTIKNISDSIDKFLKKQNYVYRVTVSLNNEISTPAFGNERDIKNQKIVDGIEEFRDKMVSINNSNLPTHIETSIGTFKVEKSPFDMGYTGSFQFSVIFIPDEKIIDKIRKDVIDKSKKRDKWIGEHRNKFFIVALVFEPLFHYIEHLEPALFGNDVICLLDYDYKINNANEKGWKDYLEKKNILTQISYLDPKRRGIYFTVNSVKNVSGVIGLLYGRTPVFLPNPFAYEEINDPKFEYFLDFEKT